MTDPTPQAEQRVCMHCGVAIKPWTDRYVDMAGGELCQDGTQGQFPRRHTPAEPAIEVAPQGEIPEDLDAMWEASKLDTNTFVGSEIRMLIGRITRAESALTAAREERGTAQAALREAIPYITPRALQLKAIAALKPVSDRQPEGEKP